MQNDKHCDDSELQQIGTIHVQSSQSHGI